MTPDEEILDGFRRALNQGREAIEQPMTREELVAHQEVLRDLARIAGRKQRDAETQARSLARTVQTLERSLAEATALIGDLDRYAFLPAEACALEERVRRFLDRKETQMHCYEPVAYLASEQRRHETHTRQLEQVGWFAWDGRFYPLGDQPLDGRAPMGFAPCYVEVGDE